MDVCLNIGLYVVVTGNAMINDKRSRSCKPRRSTRILNIVRFHSGNSASCRMILLPLIEARVLWVRSNDFISSYQHETPQFLAPFPVDGFFPSFPMRNWGKSVYS